MRRVAGTDRRSMVVEVRDGAIVALTLVPRTYDFSDASLA